jgi:hypothetical protein
MQHRRPQSLDVNRNSPELAPAAPPLSHGFGGDTVAIALSQLLQQFVLRPEKPLTPMMLRILQKVTDIAIGKRKTLDVAGALAPTWHVREAHM